MRSKRWSDDLLALTREILQRDMRSREVMSPMKHIDGRFGIALSPAESGEYIVTDRATGVVHFFRSMDELIDDGWAID